MISNRKSNLTIAFTLMLVASVFLLEAQGFAQSQRDAVCQKFRSNEFIDSIVASHIFTNRMELAFSIEEARRVQTACSFKEILP